MNFLFMNSNNIVNKTQMKKLPSPLAKLTTAYKNESFNHGKLILDFCIRKTMSKIVSNIDEALLVIY